MALGLDRARRSSWSSCSPSAASPAGTSPRSSWSPTTASGRAAVDVEGVAPGRIALAHSDEADRPGIYGLVWHGGHAIVGPILSSDEDTRHPPPQRRRRVPGPRNGRGLRLRRLHGQSPGRPRASLLVGARSRANSARCRPGWCRRRPGRTRIWAIVVHGINGNPAGGAAARADPASGRPDLAADHLPRRPRRPQQPRRPSPPGQTEWRDLEAAARYALAHGARRLVLVGYSMGGAVIAQFMERSRLAPRVAALVLDAPALDWRRILEFNATEMGLPGVFGDPARVGDRRPHRRRLGQPRRASNTRRTSIFRSCSSTDRRRRRPDRGQRRVRRRAAATGSPTTGSRRPDTPQSWNVDPASTKARLDPFLEKPCKTRRFEQKQNEPDRRGRARMLLNEEPAATYSPRGLPPKYHRRRVA